ncbi:MULTISPECIES: hypothetical protein [unclassified Streptomyces]|uniref:hypothetical protein n=1 Tax=unclassified Streptomyces TaxID=2593676 RepID=UPI0033DB804E
MTFSDIAEYRLEHLRQRLARGEVAELGVRAELRGGHAVIWGNVTSEACREAVLRVAEEELVGIDWREDLTVSRFDPPDHREELL